jgi:hypothetical protein
MTRTAKLTTGALALLAGAAMWTEQAGGAPPPKGIALAVIGGHVATDPAGGRLYDEGAVEISAYDPVTRRVFLTLAERNYVEVVDLSDPAVPVKVQEIPLTPWGAGASATSVDFRDGVLAVAVPQGPDDTAPGRALFFDAFGALLADVTVGALPDMITFTPNGELVLTANEGQPNDAYDVDPEGSVSVIDMSVGAANLTDAHVANVGFAAFNDAVLDPSIRIFGPGGGPDGLATVAEDLEPEYIAVSHDSRTAWVTLQENNAIAIIDLKRKVVTDLVGLGFKDHSLPGNGLDGNRNDDTPLIANWPVFGVYMPDTIASFTVGPTTYLVTANEGDAREYAGLGAPHDDDGEEPVRLEDVVLDPVAFPSAAVLQDDDNAIGDLNITSMSGDADGDGDYDVLYTFGARSFTIWTTAGSPVFDSGDQLETITSATYPDFFNASNTNSSIDNRSDDKGPEPEGVTHAKLFGRDYIFVMLERIGGVVVYDVSTPAAPVFQQYINWRDLSVDPDDDGPDHAGDLGPESARVIQAEHSPNGQPLLLVTNEVSGSLRVFQISQKK